MIQGHGGNIASAALELGCSPEDIVDMSSNINPLGVMPGLLDHLCDQLDRVMVLPEVDAGGAVAAMARILDLDPGRILMGTGTTQFIYNVCPALESRRVLIVGPTYADYASSCAMHRVEADFFLARAEDQFLVDSGRLAEQARSYDTVFLCNPDNPTGQLIPHDQLLALCSELPETTFIIDESYLSFLPVAQDRSMVNCGLANVVVLWSISKIFGIPGLRAGFLVADPEVLSRFGRYMQPWCANSLAQEAVVYLADHGGLLQEFLQVTKEYLDRELSLFRRRLAETSLELYPSHTPYQLIRLPQPHSAESVSAAMLRERILIRNCSNFHGLDQGFVRISLKGAELNRRAAHGLRDVILEGA
ncbi:pyridoxal phosphate-dependent aminotransferase [Desulfogranum mediterraneum]|uniref:pyridoxal phosphate-dependent aminotransferase n=1 Tax=Desulfogranum mediterraneum TaxID=160661 RepID=UPI00041D4840|nr:aminotransferase class I/II-fold pyridoxal phosphate-dependent enzyme [Desulfogranum mediterraneum]